MLVLRSRVYYMIKHWSSLFNYYIIILHENTRVYNPIFQLYIRRALIIIDFSAESTILIHISQLEVILIKRLVNIRAIHLSEIISFPAGCKWLFLSR